MKAGDTALTALKYFGGKAYHWPWILSHLPDLGYKSLYVEPYAGMLSVLLNRCRVEIEIVNDLNSDIAGWWTHVRDHTEALTRAVSLTPRSREALDDAWAVLESEDAPPLERARATHVCLAQGIHGKSSGKPSWSRAFTTRVGSPFHRWLPEDFAALAERMSKVYIDNTDAVKLLRRVANEENLVAYVDPPYHSATPEYQTNDVAVDDLTDALLTMKGRVAVSGYGAEWDRLGWRVVEKEVVAHSTSVTTGGVKARRVERLWMNYEPAQGDLLSRT